MGFCSWFCWQDYITKAHRNLPSLVDALNLDDVVDIPDDITLLSVRKVEWNKAKFSIQVSMGSFLYAS